ncbi:MAG: sigma-70 family RNA polymerase sigma factor [Armatimonadetes bacterium]|nr:sigma-70 family RNA polymerase sigma factor [Armatimonadota bacterium]
MAIAQAFAKTFLKQDKGVFDELVRRHYKQLYNVAYRLTGNAADAEDLMQEAFLKAYQAFDRYRADRPFEHWMYRILTNAHIDNVRKRPKVVIEPLDKLISTREGDVQREIPDESHDPEQAAIASELESEIQHALKKLPEDFRKAIVLCDIEGLSYEEIADILGCSIGTVRSRIHRGRKQLQKSLSEYLKV